MPAFKKLLLIYGIALIIPANAMAAILNVPAQYPTIHEAVNNAQSGDEIKVAAGTYKERVVLKAGVILSGEDAKTTTITTAEINDEPLITTIGDCTVSNFTIMGGSGSQKGTVFIQGGSPTINLNIIRDNETVGIVIQGGAAPTIKENLIYNNRGSGINVMGSSPIIISNEIFKNYGNGIYSQGSNSKIENNHIYQNSEAGVSISFGTAKGTNVFARVEGEAQVLNNKIEENKAAGLISENTSPIVTGNTIENKGRPGILLFVSGAVIQQNHLISSGPPAIHINAGSSPVIQNNKISGTRRFPILGETKSALIKDNQIENVWEPKFHFK